MSDEGSAEHGGVDAVRHAPGDARNAEEIAGRFEAEGLSPHSWSNGPAYVYDWHSHGYDKLLYCVSGGITFHTRGRDVVLEPGDRLEIAAGTEHAATVGPSGVQCMEARR